MKKNIVAISSLCFLFTFIIVLIAVSSSLFSIRFLWSILAIEVLSILWSFVVLLNHPRRIETRIRWAIFIVFVPLIGLCSYIYFGRTYKNKTTTNYKYKNFDDFREHRKVKDLKEHALPIIDRDLPHYKRAFLMGLNLQFDLIYNKTKVEMFATGPSAWIQVMRDLNRAKKYILINMYIIDDGELYRNVSAILKAKARAGVKIYIMYDFFGCYGKFTSKMRRELTTVGIQVAPFAPATPPFINWTVNYRNHRKDISIDGKIGFTGGMNLADEYVNINKRFGLWNDLMVKITGDAVQGLEKIFTSDWKFYTNRLLIDELPEIGCPVPVNNKETSAELVQVVSSGPNHSTPLHFDLFLNLVNSAQKRIWLATPYFVPPTELIKALTTASRSGIDVRILLPGKTDMKFVLDVSRYWTDELYKAGVKIYSMNDTFSHMKAYLFDDEISFVGSTNLDFRSFFSDQQTMLLIKSKTFSKALSQRFENNLALSFLYAGIPSRQHNHPYQLLVRASNIIAPLL